MFEHTSETTYELRNDNYINLTLQILFQVKNFVH